MRSPVREALETLWTQTFGDVLLDDARAELDRLQSAGLEAPAVARLVERLPRLLADIEARENELERIKTAFLANIGHELRTPLQGVMGMLELLGRAPSMAPRQRVQLETLGTAAQALVAVVNDLLDWTDAEQGRLELSPAPCDLREMLASVVAGCASSARERRTRLETTIDADVPRMLSVDPARLRQVMHELLLNALKSTQGGRIDIEACSPDAPDHERIVEISVRDTGTGLAPEVLAAVLEPFAQPPSNSIRRFGGTGLGLALAARLVERMGGLLWVDSAPGAGTVACLRIPLAAGSATDGAAAATPAPSSADAVSAGPMVIRNVLVAEDNPINQLVASAMLEQLGCRCTIAQTGREAVDRWYADPYDLLLMDLQMPEMDGIDATREIRRREAAGHTGASGRRARIIAMSAHALDASHAEALAAGVDGYVDKPVQMTALDQIIRPSR